VWLARRGSAPIVAIIVWTALTASNVEEHCDDQLTAVVVVDATRHIISTTATTIGGFIPLIVSGGTFWPPLATAIAGGVGGSAIIELYMVPAIFMVLARRRRVKTDPTAGVLVDRMADTGALRISAG